MPEIGIISEGPTDQFVLRNIFVGYLKDRTFEFNPLQPVTDPSHSSGYSPGNWDQVLKYIQTSRFRGAFGNDFVLIQIDTDFQYTDSVGEEYRIALKDENHNDLSTEVIAENMKQLLIDLINRGQAGFYELVADKILFAITVHSMECWLLPIYYPANSDKVCQTKQCMSALNKELSKQLGFSLGVKTKSYYNAASEPYRKRKDLLKLAPLNPSFAIFMNQVQALVKVD